ncbi:MAG: hypothetical protein AB7L13_15050 [Acidimicrobiia bacterium]
MDVRPCSVISSERWPGPAERVAIVDVDRRSNDCDDVAEALDGDGAPPSRCESGFW